jgi:hypothetical protein
MARKNEISAYVRSGAGRLSEVDAFFSNDGRENLENGLAPPIGSGWTCWPAPLSMSASRRRFQRIFARHKSKGGFVVRRQSGHLSLVVSSNIGIGQEIAPSLKMSFCPADRFGCLDQLRAPRSGRFSDTQNDSDEFPIRRRKSFSANPRSKSSPTPKKRVPAN